MNPFEIQGVSQFVPTYNDGDSSGVREGCSDSRVEQLEILFCGSMYT